MSAMFDRIMAKVGYTRAAEALPVQQYGTSEIGHRPRPEDSYKYLFRRMWVDADFRAVVLDIRDMDAKDGRVKKIHSRTARDAIKGGLIFTMPSPNETIIKAWRTFHRRLQLNNPQKLKSDARGLFMEGNLPYQWVLSSGGHVTAGIRMPSETMLPDVGRDGRFLDVRNAYIQRDLNTGSELARFALWQLTMGRIDPQNFDDMGSMGRPYLDASRSVWKKLQMTDEDLVIRRRTRAPLRLAHVLEGADKETLDKYREEVEADQASIKTDFYMNKKGTVTAVQGDARLDQIADVSYLLDTFFAGGPAPKALFGYTDGLNRDILEDLKKDYYEEVDALQDVQADVYRAGFFLDLLLMGVNPIEYQFNVAFAERRTETPNQAADRALKWQALGMPQDEVMRVVGKDPETIREMLEEQAMRKDPYPDPGNIGKPPKISITPGNQRKGESGTDISTGVR